MSDLPRCIGVSICSRPDFDMWLADECPEQEKQCPVYKAGIGMPQVFCSHPKGPEETVRTVPAAVIKNSVVLGKIEDAIVLTDRSAESLDLYSRRVLERMRREGK